MIKAIVRIGKSQGVMFDAALMDLAGLKVGDKVNVTVHEGRSTVLTPLHKVTEPKSAAAAAKRLIRKNPDLFSRLSQESTRPSSGK
jgi:antitoxin component of MazEF toxin-antitoxin module